MFDQIVNLFRGKQPEHPKYDWNLDYEPFGYKQNERIIEIPWAISHYKDQKRVLEIGPVGAQPEYLEALRNLHIPELHGLDITEQQLPGFKMKFGDVRNTDYPSDYFDLIYCISTLEHVGRDNTIYTPGQELPADSDGDIKGLQEIERILKPGGSVLLTFPYGKFHNYGWFVHYDEKYLTRLISSTKLQITEERYFHYQYKGWYAEYNKNKLRNSLYRDKGAPNACGLVCLQLTKV